MTPFCITITDNHVQIGCELLRKTNLSKDGMDAAKKHGMDKTMIAKYKKIVMALLDTK